MKKGTKALLLSFCAVALVVGSVLGTMAYLTDSDKVTNTFTVGKVDIDLKESKVTPDGNKVNPSDPPSVESNDYHLLPGHIYTKDPTVTVKAGSEESYIKVTATVSFAEELDAIFAATNMQGVKLTDVVLGYDKTVWLEGGNVKNVDNTRTYTFYYKETVAGKIGGTDADVTLTPLFTAIKVPGVLTNEQLATLEKWVDNELVDQMKITVNAYAIQADGFADAAAAWAAYTNP